MLMALNSIHLKCEFLFFDVFFKKRMMNFLGEYPFRTAGEVLCCGAVIMLFSK